MEKKHMVYISIYYSYAYQGKEEKKRISFFLNMFLVSIQADVASFFSLHDNVFVSILERKCMDVYFEKKI
jgi:hypothetical protein